MNHQLDQEVVAGFISEAKGYLPEIMLGLEAFAADAEQLGSLREAFRFAHIIKGAASMLGFMQISEVAYQLEVTLEMLCEEHLPLTPEMLEDLCRGIGELADLLEQGLSDVPPVASVPSVDADEASAATNDVSSDIRSSSPELPSLDLPAAESADARDLSAFTLPAFSLTPSDCEEKGETILLDDDVLPEVTGSWTATVRAELEMEEPLVALLSESSFSVSLPETASTPTIGDLDLANVAQELKESFGSGPLPPQPEFALPDELMAELPDFQLDQSPLDDSHCSPSATAAAAETLETESSGSLLDVPGDSEADATSNLAFDHLADQLAEDLLTAPTPAADLPAEDLPAVALELESLLPTMDEPVQEAMMGATLDESWPELLPLPDLPELVAPTDCDEPLALTEPPAEENADVVLADEPATTLPPPVRLAVPLSTSSSAALSDDLADELMETFLLEAEEHLQNLHTSLRVLYKNPDNRDLLQQVRRSSHSLKGTAAMIGLDNIMQLAHRMEDVLDLIWDGEMQLTTDRTLLLMQATDALEDMSNGQTRADEVQRLYAEFARVLTSTAPAPVTNTLPTSDQEDAASPTLAPEPFSAAEPESLPEMLPAMLLETASETSAEAATETATETGTEETTLELDLEPAALDLLAEPAAAELDIACEPLSETDAMSLAAHFATPPATEPDLLAASESARVPAANTEVEAQVEAHVEAHVEPQIEAVSAASLAVPTSVSESAVVASAPTPEPEVLPASHAGAMAQASSQFVRVPIDRLDEVVKLISEMIITRTTFEQRLADFARQVEELQIAGTRLRRASSNLESKYEASTLGGGRPAVLPGHLPAGLAALAANGLVNSLVTHNTYGFDDLEFDRYTEFHLVSRELVESSTDIQTLGRELGHLNGDFLGYLNRQGRIYTDLQDRLMRLRMVPLGNLAPRLHRTVRTVAVQQGKDVELILEGDTTAIDTTALQEMTDPLLHLLRNAVDHGIEAPEARVAKGKASLGQITLRAFYEGSQVVIQLRDDGQGLNAQRIRERALEYGLLTAAEAEAMSVQELWSLIFTPGFSTATTISEISGRGVGMDVVHSTVQRLKGTIIIDSQPNAGTTFTIRLPLTLAVTRSLMVRTHGQSFAIPLDVVTQIMRLEMSKVERIGKEPVIRLGGKVYPLMMLSRLLNLRQASDEVSARPPALLLNVEGKEIVVIVDQLMGGREVVIKTLGNHLRKVHGVMGATLMGDGEVVLILNLAELLRGTVRRLTRRMAPTPALPVAAAPDARPMAEPSSTRETSAPVSNAVKKTLTIMVVDDSPSVRRVSSSMIKNVGWVPVQAKDGLDALEQLQASETPPDLILLDIEMPRMDGYQFLGSIRSLSAYRHLPVVIVSSRSSEKHRQKAFDVGATDYLVKPYQEDNVIALIQRLVKKGHQ